MSESVYVRNLPFETTEEELAEVSRQWADVRHVKICFDRETGRSKGYGFVEVRDGAAALVQGLDGYFMGRRVLRAELARPRGEKRPPRGHDAQRSPYV